MISINGKTYTGNSVTVANGKVMIDGKLADQDGSKEIYITVNGNVENLNIDYCDSLDIGGDCGTVQSTNGDLKIYGNVWGSVTNKNGNIRCGDVGGNVTNKNGNIKKLKK